MHSWEWAILGLKITWTVFCFAYGACVGSLINVLAYRMPRGMSVVSPPSRCPSCGTRLTWRENIPVLGWVLLRGKCRFCKSAISPEYPLVEAAVGVLFALFYVLYYFVTPGTTLLGLDVGAIRPDWYRGDATFTWPTFVLLLVLLGSLAAATLVDAKTSTIPLPIVWVPAGAAVIIHVGHAVWVDVRGAVAMTTTPGWTWAIPTPGPTSWGWIGAALGGMVGLGASNVLMAFGLITRSFADYDEWEAKARAGRQSELEAGVPTSGCDDAIPDAKVTEPKAAAEEPGSGGRPEDMWIQYPHARREMVKELAFLCLPVLLAIGGWMLAERLGGTVPGAVAPNWLRVLSGVCLGYLVGGGVVWAVRIFGSAAFGKEAMGLGDVHLMAAVGACLGWIDATLAFFGAAFVGLAWAMIGPLLGGAARRAMPYGPFLAVATVLVLVFKPWIERLLEVMAGQTVQIP